MNRLCYFIFDERRILKEREPLKQGFKLIEFKPSVVSLRKHAGPPLLLYLFWFLMTKGKYRIYYVVNNEGKIIHYSHVLTKFYKFSFMKKNDMEIGPSWTDPASRGLGIYPAVIGAIARQYAGRCNIHIFSDEDNNASINGIMKAGFRFYGKGYKKGFFGIYKITEYAK